jgi:hypothetical protein
MWPALKELFKSAFNPEMPGGWRFITVVVCCATIALLGFLYRDHILYFGPAATAPQEMQFPVVNRERKGDSLIDRSTIATRRIEQAFDAISNNPQVATWPELLLEYLRENQRYVNVPMPRPREKRNYYKYYIEVGEGNTEEKWYTYECGRDGWPPECYLPTDAERREEARKALMERLEEAHSALMKDLSRPRGGP